MAARAPKPVLRPLRGGARGLLEDLDVGLARSRILFEHGEAAVRAARRWRISAADHAAWACPCDLCAFAERWFARRARAAGLR